VPIVHSGHRYNFPVEIWLPEAYPSVPPIAYVVPVAGMMIKRQHSFVDASGAMPLCVPQWQRPAVCCASAGRGRSDAFGQPPKACPLAVFSGELGCYLVISVLSAAVVPPLHARRHHLLALPGQLAAAPRVMQSA
jgi:hypothetical protein